MFNVPEFVAQCIFFDRAPREQTGRFVTLNHDVLCAGVLKQLEVIADLCQRDTVHPSITQGPRDQGGDVLLRFKKEGGPGLIVFQVKSHSELDDGLSKALKASWHDVQSHYNDLDRYYIALFGDLDSKAKRITAISTEFANSDAVRVVEPDFLATFLTLDAAQIEGVYQRLTGPVKWSYETEAFSEAKQFEDDDQLYFALACMFHYFENRNDSLPEAFYLKDSRLSERFDHQQISEFRAHFADGLLEIWASREDRLRVELLRGVEAMFRCLDSERGWDYESAFAYMFAFLRKPVATPKSRLAAKQSPQNDAAADVI